MNVTAIGKPQAIINEEMADEMEMIPEETKEEPRLKTTRSKIDAIPRSLIKGDGNNSSKYFN